MFLASTNLRVVFLHRYDPHLDQLIVTDRVPKYEGTATYNHFAKDVFDTFINFTKHPLALHRHKFFSQRLFRLTSDRVRLCSVWCTSTRPLAESSVLTSCVTSPGHLSSLREG